MDVFDKIEDVADVFVAVAEMRRLIRISLKTFLVILKRWKIRMR